MKLGRISPPPTRVEGLTPEDNRSPAAEVAPEPPVAPDSAVKEGVEARQGKALGVFFSKRSQTSRGPETKLRWIRRNLFRTRFGNVYEYFVMIFSI